jgi:hypothetical protein
MLAGVQVVWTSSLPRFEDCPRPDHHRRHDGADSRSILLPFSVQLPRILCNAEIKENGNLLEGSLHPDFTNLLFRLGAVIIKGLNFKRTIFFD